MPFDSQGRWIRPHNYQSERLRGIAGEAIRFDEDADDFADGMTYILGLLQGSVGSEFNPQIYYTRTQMASVLDASWQPKLGYTPLNPSAVGVTIAPLGSDLKIPSQYLPAAQVDNSGIDSFNGRTGAVTLSSDDISSLLGFLPEAPGSPRSISQVTGLQSALNDRLRYASLGQPGGIAPLDSGSKVPAEFVSPIPIDKVSGLQAELDSKQNAITNLVTYLATQTAATTAFPIGQTLMIDLGASAKPKRREAKVIYTGILDTDGYNIAGAGSALVGTWVCNGTSGTMALFQRVA